MIRYDNELNMPYTYNHHLGSNKTTLIKCLIYMQYHRYLLLFANQFSNEYNFLVNKTKKRIEPLFELRNQLNINS